MNTRVFALLAWFAPLGAPVYPVGALAVQAPLVWRAAWVPYTFETGRVWRVRLREPAITGDRLDAWLAEGMMAEADLPDANAGPAEAADALLSRLLAEVLPVFDEWSR